MTEKELNKARITYRNYQKEKEELEEKKKRLEKLKNTPEVMEYLKLQQYENDKVLTDDEIIDIAFFAVAYEHQENIYVYGGNYTLNSLISNLTGISIENSKCYNIYINVESGKIIHQNSESVEKFEKENIIIKISEDETEKNEEYYKELYNQIRREYLRLLTYKSQEEVVEKIKTKTFNTKTRKFI